MHSISSYIDRPQRTDPVALNRAQTPTPPPDPGFAWELTPEPTGKGTPCYI